MSLDKELLVPNIRLFSFLHFETHEDYVAGGDDITCGLIMKIRDARERCDFAMSDTCREMNTHFQYSKWVFCDMAYGDRFYLCATPVFVIMLAAFYITLIVNNYSSHVNNIISAGYILKFEEHLSGVVLLGALHGIPDLIMSNFGFGLPSERREDKAFVAANSVYGTTMASCLLGGILAVTFPLNVRSTTFLMDHFFFLVMLVFAHVTLLSSKIHMYQSIILILLYAIYIFCMSLEYYYRYRKDNPLDDEPSSSIFHVTNPMYNLRVESQQDFEDAKSPNDQLFRQFLRSLNPIMELNRRNIVTCRALYLMMDPFRIVIQLIVPTVNYTIKGHGWSKLLNCLNCILTPLLLIFLYRPSTTLCITFSSIGLALAILVFFTSRTDRPPVYHAAFIFYGLIGNVIINTYAAEELVSLYSTVGAITGMPKQAIQLLLLPWGRLSIDLVTNFTLANRGYRVTAFSSLLNQPLFENFFCMGLATLLIEIRHGKSEIPVRFNALGETTLVFIYAFVFGRTIAIMLTRYQVRRSTGIFLIGIYTIYAQWILLTEISIIHALSVRHTAISDPDSHDVEWA